MHIEPTKQISELQQEFNSAFPFLKIEFFRSTDNSGLKHNAVNKLPSTYSIGRCQLEKTEGDIIFTQDTRVGDLEKQFQEEYSLNVQVFRRSGAIWLETTMTDKWTLKQQNDHGREISTEKSNPNKDNNDDYGLTRDADN